MDKSYGEGRCIVLKARTNDFQKLIVALLYSHNQNLAGWKGTDVKIPVDAVKQNTNNGSRYNVLWNEKQIIWWWLIRQRKTSAGHHSMILGFQITQSMIHSMIHMNDLRTCDPL